MLSIIDCRRRCAPLVGASAPPPTPPRIAERGEPVEIADIDAGSHWIADPIWAKREQICGFVGQPLIHKEEVLGLLGVFLRVPVIEEGLI